MMKRWYIKDGVLSRDKVKDATVFEVDGAATEIVIPDGVKKIDHYAFSSCQMNAIIIPNSVTTIDAYAFENSKKLTHITIPDSVQIMAGTAFMGCNGITHFAIDENNPSFTFVDGCIYDKPMSKLVRCIYDANIVAIPDGVMEIGWRAFSGCKKLTSITIPNTVKEIDVDAFEDCGKLTNVTLPNSVTRIGVRAFSGCKKLISITIPDSVMEIGYGAFETINHVYVNTWNDSCHKNLPDSVLIHTDDLMMVPPKRRICAAIAFCEDGRSFDDEVGLAYAKYLKSSAGKIVPIAMQYPALMQALLRERLIEAKDIDAFHTAAREENDTELIAQLLDYQASVLTNTKVMKTRAQKVTKLEEMQEQVADRTVARADKKDLSGLVFAVTHTPATFASRKELKTLLEGYGAKLSSTVTAKTDFFVTNDMSSTSENCRKAMELGVDVIDDARLNEMLYRRFTDAVEVVIPEWVKEIAGGAFERCNSLTRVTIPQGVEWIGSKAFQGCVNLASIKIPSSVCSIDWGAFHDCVNLTSVFIEGSNTAIYLDAFKGCTNLTIHAPAGSYAEKHAIKHNITFVVL